MKKPILYLFASMTIFLSSCDPQSGKKTNAIDISGKTKQEVFMLHSWELSSWKDSSAIDKVENIETCSKDDFYSFVTTAQMEINRNNIKCDPSEKQTEIMAWSMVSANDPKVMIFTYDWDISSMTGEQIVLRRKYLYNFGGTTDYIYSKVVLIKH